MPNLGLREFTCAQTPLHLTDISLNDITVSTTSGITFSITGSGPLKITERPSRDGVNIEERIFTATYRNQTYTSIECIFHSPGLHIFPGKNSVYNGEYHLHMGTNTQPRRNITIVIPILQATSVGQGNAYFAACKAQPNASQKPSLATLLPYGSSVLQYQGPDLRRRTLANPTNADCTDLTKDLQFLMVINPVYIMTADLDRIRRAEYSGLNRDAHVPVVGVAPLEIMPRSKILNQIVLAVPGIIDPNRPATSPAAMTATTAAPARKEIDINLNDSNVILESFIFAIGIFVGVMIMEFVSEYFWSTLFKGDDVKQWSPLKFLIIAACIVVSALWYREFLNYWRIS
jgi:hypothetical protein